MTNFSVPLNRFYTTTLFSSILMTNAAFADTSTTSSVTLEAIEILDTYQAYQGEFTPLETPQAEQKIDAISIKNSGAVTLDQALDLASSVGRQNNFGGLWNSFSVRGFVGDENLPSNYLVNGFNAGRGFGGPRDLSGVESVEVLKGPRAALYGRGEPGGTINLVTKRPTFEEQGEIILKAGSFNTYRTDLDWTSPLSDNFAIRMVGFYEDAESFRDTVETTKYGFNPSATYLIGEDSQLTYELEYSHQEIPFDRGVIAIDGQLGQIPESRFLGEPGYGPMETDVLGHQLEFQHDFNDDWSALVGFNYRDTSLKGLASENGFSAPAANGDFSRFSRYRNYEATYQMLRAELSGEFETGTLKHRLTMGIDSDKFENDQFATRDRTTSQIINIYNPVYGNSPLSGLNLVEQINQVETQESTGVYLQDQISLTDKFDIRVGARFDDYKQELTNRRSNSTSQYSKSQVSPQLGAVYKATDTLSVYASYGENFRPLSGATDTNNLEPNQSESAEVGVNFNLYNNAIQGNFALFNVKQSNIATFDSSFNPTAVGEAESRGVELDLYGNITDSVSLLFSYTYIDAETKNDYYDAVAYADIPAGSDMMNVADHQLSVQLAKQTKLAGKDLNLIGGLLYVGDRSGQFGHPTFRLPSYTTVRTAANYQVSKSLNISAEINNLFDEEYYTNSYAQTWVQPGTPRSASVSATYKF